MSLAEHPGLKMVQPDVALCVRGLRAVIYTARGRPDYEVFSNIDLRIQRGEILSLLGASGCGKSSLLMTIAGLVLRHAGTVQLGSDILSGPDARVGVVFQDASLLPWLTVRQNIALGLKLRCIQLSRHERNRRVDQALEDVGLATFQKAYPSQLSGGMAQRVALARTIVRNPAILLLDEPFSALDAVTRLDMQRLLRQLIYSHRSSALLVTHDVDEALRVADRIALMGRPAGKAGRILRVFDLTAEDRAARWRARGRLRQDVLDALSETMGRETDLD